jgi:hypothetical protein
MAQKWQVSTGLVAYMAGTGSAQAGSDANMLTLQVTNGVVATIDSFNWTLPAN